MALPHIAAGAALTKVAANKTAQGAAGAIGARAAYALGKGTGFNQAKRAGTKALRDSGMKRGAARKAMSAAASAPSSISAQAANVATSPAGAASLGAGGYGMYSGARQRKQEAKHPYPNS